MTATPTQPTPIEAVLLDRKILPDFSLVSKQNTSTSAPWQVWRNSQSTEMMIYQADTPPVFSQAPNSDLRLTMLTNREAYANYSFCDDIDIDFAGGVFRAEHTLCMHLGLSGRRGWAAFATHSDENLIKPGVVSTTDVMQQNPFRDGVGIVYHVDGMKWSVKRFDGPGKATEAVYGYRGNRKTYNYNSLLYRADENGPNSDVVTQLQHPIRIELSETGTKVFETWNGAVRTKVDYKWLKPLPYSKIMWMHGHWIYHLVPNEQGELVSVGKGGTLTNGTVVPPNPAYQEDYFLHISPASDLRHIGRVRLSVVR